MDDPRDEDLEAQAEEYYADPDNLLDHYEREFIKHKNTEFESVYAIRLIQVYAVVKRPIPANFYPCIDDACNAWLTAKGNARLVRKAKTRREWELKTENVDILNKAAGMSKADAFEKLSHNEPETLSKRYHQIKKEKARDK